MNLEQKLISIFSLLGIVSGFISNYFRIFSLSLILPLVIYCLVFLILTKFIKEKKIKWMITNSLITFILVWLVVWIFLFNIR